MSCLRCRSKKRCGRKYSLPREAKARIVDAQPLAFMSHSSLKPRSPNDAVGTMHEAMDALLSVIFTQCNLVKADSSAAGYIDRSTGVEIEPRAQPWGRRKGLWLRRSLSTVGCLGDVQVVAAERYLSSRGPTFS